ncbi:MAG: DNA polymerase [Candidatus Methanoperedens sp.]|nr:DNA polymerase [Candidatus Methanoperedens sp.]
MNLIFVDTKTTGLDPFKDSITLLQIKQGSEIRLIKTFTDDKIADIRNLLENNLIIGHNLKFNLKFLKHQFDINPLNLFDIWIAEIIISGGMKAAQEETTALEAVVKDRLNIELNKDKELRTLFKGGEISREHIYKYAMEVAVLPPIYNRQKEELKEFGLEKVFKIEMDCIPATVWLELSGIPFDFEGLKKLQIETEKKIEDVEAKQSIGLNDENIKEYHKQQNLLTGLSKYPKYINPVTGRIHSNFNQLGAHSGRFSSSKPSLQNVPREKKIRALFKAGEGNKIITADYSQNELRIIAEVSQEPKFLEIYKNNGDLHRLTASLLLKKPESEITTEERQQAKAVNLGFAYGLGAKSFKDKAKKDYNIDISLEKAQEFRNTFFKNYPVLLSYLQTAARTASEQKQIRNKTGRLVKFEQGLEAWQYENMGRNTPIQSLSADITKTAMGRLYHKLKPLNAKLINSVHDELVFEVKEDKVKEAAQVIKEEMEAAGSEYLKSIPCIIEIVTGESWQK